MRVLKSRLKIKLDWSHEEISLKSYKYLQILFQLQLRLHSSKSGETWDIPKAINRRHQWSKSAVQGCVSTQLIQVIGWNRHCLLFHKVRLLLLPELQRPYPVGRFLGHDSAKRESWVSPLQQGAWEFTRHPSGSRVTQGRGTPSDSDLGNASANKETQEGSPRVSGSSSSTLLKVSRVAGESRQVQPACALPP